MTPSATPRTPRVPQLPRNFPVHPEHTDVLISVAARMLIRRVAPSTVVAYLASHLAAESDVYLAYVAARLLAPYVE